MARTRHPPPAPYNAPPLFLFGRASWRDGNGALAGTAATRALHADPDYTAARLLLTALTHALDPRRVARLHHGGTPAAPRTAP